MYREKKNRLKNFAGIVWIYIATILPYVEISIVREALEIQTKYMEIPAVAPIMLFLWILLYLGNRIHGYYRLQYCKLYYSRLDLLLFLWTLMNFLVILFHESKMSSYYQLLLFILPYLFAKEVIIRVKSSGLYNCDIVKYAVSFFIISQLVFLIINIVVYGFSFDGKSESRILSVGGGPVILGYTVVLSISCWMIYRDNTKLHINLLVLIGGLILSFATGSRGSMWPSILLLVTYFVHKNGKFSSIKSLIVLIGFIAVFFLADLGKIFPRLFLFDDGSRISSIISNLYAFSFFSPMEVLFGKGVGNFFPYQQWNMNHSSGIFFDYNRFLYNGIPLLVQPHNSFIYALMETGIVGLALYIRLIKTSISFKFFSKCKKKFEYLLFSVILLLVLTVESTFFVATGSASLWWFLIMLIGSSDDSMCEKRYK